MTFLPLVLWLAFGQQVGDSLPVWTTGTLDIHQIHTGRGNAALLVFPDGKTMLIDAGMVPDKPGPELGPRRPNATRTTGEWIAQYIRQFSPRPELHYALITHYHDDHLGAIADVAKLIPIGTLIDRGDEPAPMAGRLIDDYRAFRRTQKSQTILPGRSEQIASAYAGFEVRNVAANGEVWTGRGTETKSAFPANWKSLPVAERPTENHFSIALRIRYGSFDYFTGGDLPGVVLDNLPEWHDVETPVARAIGRLDTLVLNHHGWLDSTNAFFLQTLAPRVVIVPAWHATHPDHSVFRRLVTTRIYAGPRDLFATTLLDAPRAIFSYLGEKFKSTAGHVVIRVAPGGGSYHVLILDDTNERHAITAIHGPYSSN